MDPLLPHEGPQAWGKDRSPTTCIVREEKYFDNAGREVRQAELIDGSIDEQIAPFMGITTLKIPVPGPTGMQLAEVQLQFPIDAVNIVEAFAKYDERAEQTSKEWLDAQKEAQRDQASGILKPGDF